MWASLCVGQIAVSLLEVGLILKAPLLGLKATAKARCLRAGQKVDHWKKSQTPKHHASILFLTLSSTPPGVGVKWAGV